MRSARRGSRPGIFMRSVMLRLDQLLAQAVNLLGRDAEVADLVARAAAIGGRDRAEAENRARRADHAIESGAPDVAQVFRQLVVDMADELALVASRQRIGVDESLGQPDDAELEALGDAERGARAVGDLDAAAADVDDHRRCACNIDAVDRRQVNQPRFFGAGNDLRLDAGFALDRGEKFAAVFGLAHGAGRCGENFLDLMRLGQPAEARERLQSGRHRLGGQRLAVESARPEADHLLFAIDDLEGQIGPDADHDHVNRICTAVDRRYPHLFDWKRVVAVIQTSYNGGDRSDGAAHSPPHPSMNASTSCDRLWRKRLNELSAVWPDFVGGRTDRTAQDARRVAPHSRSAADRRRVARRRRRSRSSTRRCAR